MSQLLGSRQNFLKLILLTLTEEKFQRQQNFKILPKTSVNAGGLARSSKVLLPSDTHLC